MRGLVGSELLKVRSTRMWIGLVGGAVAFVLLNVAAQIFTPSSPQVPGVGTEQGVRNVWASAGTGSLFALVLGILAMTTEFRFKTLSATFLATPGRARVVVAKMVALGIVGLALSALCALVTAVVAVPLLALKDAPSIPVSTIGAIVLGAVVAGSLYAVIGVAVGTLVPNQIAAVVGAFIWVLLIEGLLVALLPEVGKWLPGGAANSMLQASSLGNELLDPWLGAVVFVGYAVVFVAIAMRTTLRRDVT